MRNKQRPYRYHKLVRILLTCCLFPGCQSLAASDAANLTAQQFSVTANSTTPGATVAQLDTKRPDYAAKGNITVFYPNVSDPYRGIFTQIIEGIEERTKGKVRSFAIDNDKIDAADLNLQLKRSDTKVVIALGRVGVKAASAIDHDIPVVVGGILTLSETDQQSLNGISLNPDPALLFSRLKALLPEVKKVLVVYNPQHNEMLLKLAREAAKTQGLEITTYEARDLATAAKSYETLFANSDKQHSALWLPNDPTTVEENTVLPLILRESWNNSLPIFSSSLVHVKRGVLFALYPNNLELGKNLANSALAVMAGEARKKGMQPLREVQIAVNLRTASHIGLQIGPQQQRSFDFVFPEP